MRKFRNMSLLFIENIIKIIKFKNITNNKDNELIFL